MRQKRYNSVYFGTEKRILIAFAKLLKDHHSVDIRTSEVVREAGIATSSFYIHYHSLIDIIDKNERLILTGLDKIVSIQMQENSTIEKKLNNILFYLYRYRELLDVICGTHSISSPLNIMNHIRAIIECGWPNYCNTVRQRLYNLIIAEYLAELQLWWQEQFSIDFIPTHAKRLAYFTVNTPRFYAAIYHVDRNSV